MRKITVVEFECNRCGHRWIPRKKDNEKPTLCPHCKSAWWDKPRQRVKKK